MRSGKCVPFSDMTTHLPKVLAGHLGHDLVEHGLVIIIDETVVEDAQSLVTEEMEDLLALTDYAHISLQDAYRTQIHRGRGKA